MRQRSPRSDALAHRDQLLIAAEQVFAEHGVNAPLDLVVTRAGVGRATLYRNFADRRALMSALMDQSLDRMEAVAHSVSERDDGLFHLLEHMAQRVLRLASVADFWRALPRDDALVESVQRRYTRILQPALERARTAGLCRADLRPADLILISAMLGTALRGRSDRVRQAMARRVLSLITEGVRA